MFLKEWKFMYLFIPHTLTIMRGPGSVLGSRATAGNKTKPCLPGVHVPEKGGRQAA